MFSMKTATIKLRGSSPLLQSKAHEEPKLNKEGWDAYEERTWASKAHLNDEGKVIIPAIAFKRSLDAVAKYLSVQIPGKGKSTYTKHFVSGVTIGDCDLVTQYKIDEVIKARIHCNSDGVRGSGKRVYRYFPQLPSDWNGVLEMLIFDDTITEEVFQSHLVNAGLFMGVGAFRVGNGGFCGRFQVVSIKWDEK
jgi:hypothetical protein